MITLPATSFSIIRPASRNERIGKNVMFAILERLTRIRKRNVVWEGPRRSCTVDRENGGLV